MSSVTIERVVDKIREIDARVRALERMSDTDRALDDIRTSISLIADSMATGRTGFTGEHAPRAQAARPGITRMAKKESRSDTDVTALTDPRFRIV